MSTDSDVTDDQVLFRVERGLGWVTLNRPRAINALNHTMVRALDDRLADWASDDTVAGVVVTGAGERGLCAGGDVVPFHRDATTGSRDSVAFWRDEYALNARIAEYPKPYVAVMNGFVMGGGVGVSAHGGMRLVTDSTAVSMPEVGIGFCPDVGGTWLLANTPGELGTHAALTGGRLSAGDAIVCGLADHYLPDDDVQALLNRLDADTLAATIGALPTSAPSALAEQRTWIDECYASDDAGEIVRQLLTRPEPQARAAADAITGKSPVAVAVTLRALRATRTMSLREVLARDLTMSTAALSTHDLAEGIRAQVIDKDRQPSWRPATLAEVTPEMLDPYFDLELRTHPSVALR